MEKLTYESPEIMDLGNAAELTHGWTNLDVADGCDCTKPSADQ